MTLPLLRIFVLLGQVNQLFASFFVSLAPVVVYLKLLMVLVYLFAVVSAFEQLIEPNCPLLPIKSGFWQIGHRVFQNKCDDYFDSWSSSFITLIQMFIGEVRRHVLVCIAAARADKCVHVRGGTISCIRVYGPPSEWHFSISLYTFSWSQLCSPRSL